MEFKEILSHFEGAKGSGTQYMAHCPAHPDKTPSLSIGYDSSKGATGVFCQQGCETEDVLNCVGLKKADLFDNPIPKKEYGKVVAEYIYKNEKGENWHKVQRTDDKKFPQMRWVNGRWEKGSPSQEQRILYKLPETLKAKELGETIYFVEGEKDVESLYSIGLNATCNPMGAGKGGKWQKQYNEFLKGADVVIIADNDNEITNPPYAGQKHAINIYNNIKDITKSVKVVCIEGTKKGYDVSDFIADGGTAENLKAYVESYNQNDLFELVKANEQEPEQLEINSDNASIWYDKKGRFLPRLLAEWLAENEKMFFMANNYYRYDGGYYKKLDDSEIFNKIKSHLNTYAKPKDIENTMTFLRNQIHKNYEDVDNDSSILSLKNTMLKIGKDGTIKEFEHSPEIFNTIRLNANYNPDARCDTFLKFLNEALTAENIEALQQMLGYFLTTETEMQKAFFFVGEGRCGKSTILRVVQYLLGNNNCSNLKLQDLDDRFRSSALFGKIANIFADLPEKPVEDSSNYKAITGQDTITFEEKFKGSFSYTCKAKLLFSCNKIPNSPKDKSNALYERFYFIPFNPPLPAEKRDGKLTEKLCEEIDGIFNWSLEGLRKLIANGWKMKDTDAHTKVLNEYKGLNDNVIPFVEECCSLGVDEFVKSIELYQEYREFCFENGFQPYNSNNFTTSLAKNFTISKKQKKSESTKCYIGISSIKEKQAPYQEARKIFG